MLSDVFKKKINIDDVLNKNLRQALDDISKQENVPVEQLKLLGGNLFLDLDADGKGDLTIVLPDGREFFYSAEEDTVYEPNE